jgi:hypothetical protein
VKLIRLATLVIPSEPGDWSTRCIRFGGCEVKPHLTKEQGESWTMLLSATVSLRYLPKKTAARRVVVPQKERVQAEEALELYANLFSASRHVRRRISSAMPAVVLAPDNDADKAFLDDAVGFLVAEQNRAVPGARFEFDVSDVGARLTDRFDGVAILAETLSQEHASGRFREVLRVFERAFALGGRNLVNPAAEFLHGFGHGYTREEVDAWIDMRDGLTHADQRNKINFEGDAAWVVQRVMQASYDVLLNKAEWRNPSVARRDCWRPPTAPTMPMRRCS